MSLPRRPSTKSRLYSIHEAQWSYRFENTWRAIKRHGWKWFLVGFLLTALVLGGLAFAEQMTTGLRLRAEHAEMESAANAKLALAMILHDDIPHLDLRADSRENLILRARRAVLLLEKE